MNITKPRGLVLIVALAWVTSLMGAALWARRQFPVVPPGAQLPDDRPNEVKPPSIDDSLTAPVVFGPNVGVRVVGASGIANPKNPRASVWGTLVVNVNGDWVAVVPPPGRNVP